MAAAVVVPVFNALKELQQCLDSIERHSPDIAILLVDDASTDPGIRPLLNNWVARRESRWLLVNDSNRGFVHSANRGMDFFPDRDVILLNSDTVVTDGWFNALERCLASDARIGTATPWSNNGEIVSFPSLCEAAEIPRDPDAVARIIRVTGQAEYPELPTAVGFCMAVSRNALDRCGPFNEAQFGRGYGEENDFSMRVAAAGMRNVLCDDAYVAHHGGSSFGALGMRPDESSMARLLSLHPGYLERVTEFIRQDPLAPRRQALVDAVHATIPG